MFNKTLAVCLVAAVAIGCGGDDEPEFIGGPDDNYGGIVEGPSGPIAGATVTLVGSSPLVSTTTNGDGLFAVQLPDGETTILVEAGGHWGSQQRVRIFAPQVFDDIEIELASDGEVAEAATELGVAIDSASGVVAMSFFTDSADLTGVGGTITATSEPPFTFDAEDEIVSSSVILPNSGEPELIFANVAVGPTSATASGTATVGCSTEFDTVAEPFVIRAKVITEIRIFCGNI